MTQLPDPSEEALAHSERMKGRVREAVMDAGGWIPFSRYMDLVLYSPGLGYYSAGSEKIGEAGDFVTAPEISSLFGQTLARFASAWFAENSHADLLELGAGTGKLAFDFLSAEAPAPGKYYILEPSADLREKQRQKLAGFGEKVQWLDSLPESFEGVVIANEVLDALPFSLIHWKSSGIFERGVKLEVDGFAWEDRVLEKGPLLDAASAIVVPSGYISEICPAAGSLVASLAAILKRGLMLFIDYGFGRAEYYHPDRNRGTMMCHYRHHAHDDPFFLPGLQDITAHVDFSAIAQAGVDAGLDFIGYNSQARFLIDCGIIGLLEQISPEDPLRYLPMASGLQKLVSPAEMGELFKVILFGKEANSDCFLRGDRSRAL
ncbi:MAG: class I SAM-dependent methyltransferase [Burkholderiales bacterium]|nr:class I SAM-dependent methyltransferase [Burkholderiales bacterium]